MLALVLIWRFAREVQIKADRWQLWVRWRNGISSAHRQARSLQASQIATEESHVAHRTFWTRAATLARRIPFSALALASRLSIAAVFWRSGQTKVSGFALARGNVRAVPRGVQGAAATARPCRLPRNGGRARLSRSCWSSGFADPPVRSRVCLGMTAVIQLFVYPGAWPEHALWATLLLWTHRTRTGRGVARPSDLDAQRAGPGDCEAANRCIPPLQRSEAIQFSPAGAKESPICHDCRSFSWRASRALDCFVAALLAMTQRRFASALCPTFRLLIRSDQTPATST